MINSCVYPLIDDKKLANELARSCAVIVKIYIDGANCVKRRLQTAGNRSRGEMQTVCRLVTSCCFQNRRLAINRLTKAGKLECSLRFSYISSITLLARCW